MKDLEKFGMPGGFEYNKNHNYKNCNIISVNPFNIDLDCNLYLNAFNKKLNIEKKILNNKSKKKIESKNKRKTSKNN